MTGKVKIPQEVADAIEKIRNADFSNYGIVTLLEDKERARRQGLEDERSLLQKWTFGKNGGHADKLLVVLVNSYEIEQPPLKVGDWVVFESGANGPIICVIEQVNEMSVDTDYVGSNGYKQNFGKERIRHATPEEVQAEKERRLWKSIDREVGEIKDGDIGVSRSGYKYFAKKDIERAYSEGDLVGLYPVERYVGFVGAEPNATTDN